MTRFLPAALLALAALPVAAQERFAVRLDLTSEMSAHLVERNEWLDVTVGYYGEARPEAPSESWRRVSLGSEEVHVHPVDQVLEFGGSLAAMPQGWTDEVRVQIDVSSVLPPGDASEFTCDFIDTTLDRALEKTPPDETLVECVWGED